VTFPPSTGPIDVTLTQPVDDIPRQRRTPEGQPQLAYELKIDGWRLVLSKTPAGTVELWSRRGRDLTAAFPELAAAALEHLAPGTVVDGEVCVLRYGQLDWTLTGGHPSAPPGAVPGRSRWPIALRLLRRRVAVEHLPPGLGGPSQASPDQREVDSPLAARPYDLRHACVSTWLNAGVPATQSPPGPGTAWRCYSASTPSVWLARIWQPGAGSSGP
jgi:hypothetical protein